MFGYFCAERGCKVDQPLLSALKFRLVRRIRRPADPPLERGDVATAVSHQLLTKQRW